MTDHSEFIFYTVWLGLLLGPLAGALVAFARRRHARRPDTWHLIGGIAPLGLSMFAVKCGMTFVDSRIGVAMLLVTYFLYCLTAFSMARITVSLRSAFGWVLIAPTVGGSLLGTVGVLGLAMIAGSYVPIAGGSLGPGHRYIVTTYGNATTSDEGSIVTVYKRVSWAPFLERRVFERRFDYRDVKLGTLAAVVDQDDGGRAVVMSEAVRLAVVSLD